MMKLGHLRPKMARESLQNLVCYGCDFQIGGMFVTSRIISSRGEFGRHFGSIFELGKCVIKCSVVR